MGLGAMTTRAVDTSRWNLFGPTAWVVPVILFTGCGPIIGGDGESSGTDPTNPTDPTSPSESSPSTDPTPTPVECQNDSDCNYGYVCSGGFCEYECYCCGSLPPGYDVRCSPPWECYDDSECATGEICDYGDCRPDPVCGIAPIVTSTFEIAFSGGAGEVGALAFDTSLFVARGANVERVDSGQGTVVAHAGATIRAIALGDVDGDTIRDLLVVTDGIGGEVRLWRGEGDGFTATEFAQPLGGATVELGIGDREGDGVPDVYARSGGDIVVFPGVAEAPLGAAEIVVGGEVSAFAMVGPPTSDAFVYAAGPLLRLVDAAGVVDLALAESSSLSRIAVGGFTGTGAVDVFAHGGSPPSFLAVVDAPGAPWVISTFIDQAWDAVAVGDANADGLADVAVAQQGGTVVDLRFGAPADTPQGPLHCESTVELGLSVRHLALIGHDADADLIVSDGVGVYGYRLSP